jgi:hypothetical protein
MSRDPRAELTFTAEGGWVATGFGRRVLLMQALVGLLAFATLTLLVPWALMLETGMFADLAWAGLKVAAGAIALTAATSAMRLKRNRKVLRTLALGSDAVTPEDIGGLADIPFARSVRFIVSGLLAATAIAVPGIRPERLDDARALSLSLLMFTIIAASAVVHYVVVRESILRPRRFAWRRRSGSPARCCWRWSRRWRSSGSAPCW